MPKAKLYLAKNTEELNKLADVDPKPMSVKSAIMLADKLYVNAKDCQLNGDEEKAYVLYMRYYHVLKSIWKDSTYKKKKTAFDRQIGVERPGKAIAAAESLLDSLETRYQVKSDKDDPIARNKKQRMDRAAVVDGETNGDKKKDEEDECLFDSDSSLPEIPDAPNTPVEKRKFSAEQIFKNNSEDPLIPSANTNSNSVTNTQWIGNQSLLDISDTKAVNANGAILPAISVVALYGQLQQKPDDVIVLDCRPSSQQLACHVDYKRFPQWIEIPEEKITSGISSDSLSKQMDAERQKLWNGREDKQIVLVDIESKSVDTAGETSLPVLILKDAIYKFDLSCNLSREPLLLDGGFLRWYQTYSPYCIGKIKKKVTQQQSQTQDDVPKQVLPDYPEFPKEDPTALNDASAFSATPSGYPTSSSVGTVSQNSTTHQAIDVALPEAGNRYLVPNGPTNKDGLLTDQTVPQVDRLPVHGSGLMHTDQVVPNVNIGSLGYGGIPNGLPTGYSVHQPPPAEAFPMQHPVGDNNFTIPVVAPYGVQETTALPQGNLTVTSSHPQMNMVGSGHYPQQDMALSGSYNQPQSFVTLEAYTQDTGVPSQQSTTVPVMLPQQSNGPNLAGYMPLTQPPYSQQEMSTPDMHLQHNMAIPALYHQQEISPAHGNMVEPVPQPQHNLHPSLVPPQQQIPPEKQMPSEQQVPPQQQVLPQQHPPPQQQFPSHQQVPPQQQQNALQTMTQYIPPQNQSPVVGGWNHNPRVAYGPIPAPPSYEDAHVMPSHPPVQPPLPPPVSIPPPSSMSNPNSTVPVTVHTNPNHAAVGSDHLNWSAGQHKPSIPGTPYLDNAQNIQPIRPITPQASVLQVTQRATDAHLQAVQPVGVHMVPPRQHHHQPQQVVDNKTNPAAHHHFDPTQALNQLHAEREAALEREKQERLWLEREREGLRKKHGELEAMISRSNATEQQVMEWKQQLVAKENELSAKELDQQKALQERQKLQEQKEKEISDIAQKLNEEREALEKQKEKQQTELIRQQESIEQQKTAAMIEIQRQKDAVSHQQQELSKRQQNMEEQMSKWLQMKGESNNRQLHVQTGLPAGWEKKFDSTTGRFYYQDHNTKTTHWNPPSNWLSYNNNAQLKQGVSNNLVQPPPPQQPVPTSNSLPLPSARSTEGSNLPPSISTSTTPSLQSPSTSSVATKRPTQLPAAGHNPSTGPPAKMVPSNNRPVAVPDRSTKPQQRSPGTPVKQIPPHIWKQKMENLQPVHGGSLGPCLTGMKNFGNTCFMNSILQCLCNTVPLVVHFLNGNYRHDLNRNNPISTGGRVAEEFNVIARATWYGQYRSITPRDFKNTVAKFAPRFVTSEQQDAQEFLGFVMDGIHEDLNRVKVHHYIENKDGDGIPHHVAAQRAWDLHKRRNDSVIVDLFQGQFRSIVTCMTCRKQSVTFEAFMYLTVPIPKGGNRPTVEDCIKLFARPEKMEGSNKWFCPNCKCEREAIKKIEIWKLPKVLLIVLKRFLYHGQWRDKISTYVHYPIHELNMSPYVVGDQQPKNYHLYAVTNHTGTLHGGHYTACCRYPYNKNRFYKFDDQEVSEIGTNKLQTAAGYVLFYSSIDFVPPKIGT